nr:MAG TPA: hypothetical protein [Caudoviricetes sp.]
MEVALTSGLFTGFSGCDSKVDSSDLKNFFANCIKQCNFHRVYTYIWR